MATRFTGIADAFARKLANDAGVLEMVIVMHADPTKAEAARALSHRYPPRMDVPRGPGAVFLTGTRHFAH